MGAKLVDSRTGREHLLREEGTTIGRHDDNAISLAGRSVSRFHAEIGLGEEGWIIEDHGSTYGTFVNGRKLEGVTDLNDGDRIRLAVSRSAPDGEFSFTFHVDKAGLASRIRKVARAVVNRRRAELGEIVFERTPEMLMVRLDGIFRRREVDALHQGIAGELGGGECHIVLDLANVRYLNSYGLACLVKLATRQREKGKRMRAFGASGTVLKLLSLVGSESPIELSSSQQEAVSF